jgi:hypothetical protein
MLLLGLPACGLLDEIDSQLDEVDGQRTERVANEVVDIVHQQVDSAVKDAIANKDANVAMARLGLPEGQRTFVVNRSEETHGGTVSVTGEASLSVSANGREVTYALSYDLTITIEDVTFTHSGFTAVLNGSFDVSGTPSVTMEDFFLDFSLDAITGLPRDLSVLPCSLTTVLGSSTFVGTLHVNDDPYEFDLVSEIDADSAIYTGTVNGRPYSRTKEDLEWELCAIPEAEDGEGDGDGTGAPAAVQGSCSNASDGVAACLEFVGVPAFCDGIGDHSTDACDRDAEDLLGHCDAEFAGIAVRGFVYSDDTDVAADAEDACNSNAGTWVANNP